MRHLDYMLNFVGNNFSKFRKLNTVCNKFWKGKILANELHVCVATTDCKKKLLANT